MPLPPPDEPHQRLNNHQSEELKLLFHADLVWCASLCKCFSVKKISFQLPELNSKHGAKIKSTSLHNRRQENETFILTLCAVNTEKGAEKKASSLLWKCGCKDFNKMREKQTNRNTDRNRLAWGLAKWALRGKADVPQGAAGSPAGPDAASFVIVTSVSGASITNSNIKVGQFLTLCTGIFIFCCTRWRMRGRFTGNMWNSMYLCFCSSSNYVREMIVLLLFGKKQK